MAPDTPFGPPDFPGVLTDHTPSRCKWRYVGPSGTRVQFRLRYIDIPQSEGCRGNSLKVYSGLLESSPLIANLCGTPLETVTKSSSHVMLVVLETSGSRTFRGFEAVFEVVDE